MMYQTQTFWDLTNVLSFWGLKTYVLKKTRQHEFECAQSLYLFIVYILLKVKSISCQMQ